MPEEGQIVGEYTLVEELGTGGCGEVWKAEKRTQFISTEFAIKFFRPKDERGINRDKIIKEIEIWQSLKDLPHIISVLDANNFRSYFYIVSEFAEGGSLEKWLIKNGDKASSVEQAVNITLEILTGLEYMHNKGFVHRDLKPDNILIRRNVYCLADFGVSREIKTHSKTIGAAGTYEYMSPEAFIRNKKIEQTTDIWSVGVILQRLLTGELPFSSDNIPILIKEISDSEPEPLPDFIPQDLRQLVATALQKDAKKRFQSACEMREALEHFQRKASRETIADEEFNKFWEQQKILEGERQAEFERQRLEIESKLANERQEKEQLQRKLEEERVRAEANRVKLEEEKRREQERLSKERQQLGRNQKEQTVNVNHGSFIKKSLAAAGISLIILTVAVRILIAILTPYIYDAGYYYNLGLECKEKEDSKCAIENFNKAIELKPDNSLAYLNRGSVYFNGQNYNEAYNDYNKAIEIGSNTDFAYKYRGDVYFAKEEYDQAISDYSKSIEINNENSFVYYDRGKAYYNKSKYDEALIDFNKAIELDEKLSSAYFNRGLIYLDQEKYDQAIADYTKYIELVPNFSGAYNNRGNAYRSKKEYDKALADYNKAIEINDDDHLVYRNRGNIYFDKGDFSSAINDYTKAITLKSDYVLAFRNRANAYEKIGKSTEAKIDRQTAEVLERHQKN